MHIPEAVPPLLLGFGLASRRTTLELAGSGSAGHGGSFQKCLTKATPAALCYQNLATKTQYTSKGFSVTSLDISASKVLMVLKIAYGTLPQSDVLILQTLLNQQDLILLR